MKRNLNEWERFIAKIRTWDRMEHNFSLRDRRMPHSNLITKNDFIHSLMKEYKLQKRKK